MLLHLLPDLLSEIFAFAVEETSELEVLEEVLEKKLFQQVRNKWLKTRGIEECFGDLQLLSVINGTRICHSVSDRPSLLGLSQDTFYKLMKEPSVDRSSKAVVLEWHEFGRKQRKDDKPSRVQRSPNGETLQEEWHEKDEEFRLTGPAVIVYKNGRPSYEKWRTYQKFANPVNPNKTPNEFVQNCHRDDGPAYIIYDFDGEIESRTWFQKGLIHRDGGPAYIRYSNGRVVTEIWCQYGKEHRFVDEPSLIEYDNYGNVEKEEWMVYGKTHRNGAPAKQIYEEGKLIESAYYKYGKCHALHAPAKREIDNYTGEVIETWMQNGRIFRDRGQKPNRITYLNGQITHEEWLQDASNRQHHRDNGPASIYYINGVKVREEWYLSGEISRNYGPAVSSWYEDGTIKEIEWYENSELHNGIGPARVWYDTKGRILSKFFFSHGKLHNHLNGPTEIHYHNTGNDQLIAWKVLWHKHGKLHRNEFPASFVFDVNGKVESETWYREGMLSNKDSPSVIFYKDDKVTERHWYEKGVMFKRECL